MIAQVHKFQDDLEPEIMSRIARKRLDDGSLDQKAVTLAETILKVRMEDWPKG